MKAEIDAFAPLGILTKQLNATESSNTPETPDWLKKAAGYPLKFKLQREAQKLLPSKRVSICHRHVRNRIFLGGSERR